MAGFLFIVLAVWKPNLYFYDVQIQPHTSLLVRRKPFVSPAQMMPLCCRNWISSPNGGPAPAGMLGRAHGPVSLPDCTGTPRIIALHRHCFLTKKKKLKVFGHPASSKFISAIFPTAFASQTLSLCLILVIRSVLQPFSLLTHLLGDQWSLMLLLQKDSWHWRLTQRLAFFSSKVFLFVLVF